MSEAAPILRVDYQEGQVLSAADLADEQTYLRETRQEHAATCHVWGVVQGLKLTVSAQGLTVSPGIAADGFGRQLIVPGEIVVPAASLSGDSMSVWLVYAEEPFDAPQTGTWECGSGAPSRWREVPRVRLTTEPNPTPRDPDTSDGAWPVFLGRLQGASHTVDASGVPYIGLVGGRIRAASGAVLVRSGADFAISLPVVDKDGTVTFNDQLRIDPDGNTQFLGDAAFRGGASVQPGASPPPSGKLGIGFGPAVAPPKQASPWSVYHTQVPATPPPGQPADPAAPPLDQLRIEIAGAQDKEDPASLIASVGSSSGGGYRSGISVASDGTVTVGDLIVTGKLIQSPVQADPTDPRFLAAILTSWVNAVSAASAGYLKVSINGLAAKNLSVSYSLTFSNQSGSIVTVSTVLEIVTLSNASIPPPADIIPAFILQPNGTHDISRSVSVPKTGMFALALMVMGTAPGGIPLRAQAAQEIQVV